MDQNFSDIFKTKLNLIKSVFLKIVSSQFKDPCYSPDLAPRFPRLNL